MENDNLLYFAGINGGGGGADGELDAGLFRASDFTCVFPISATKTGIAFRADDDSDSSDDRKIDAVIVTHRDTTVTTGHRVRLIAEAMCHAVNAGPHVDGMVDVVDVDNDIYFSNFEDVSSDSGFDIQIFKNDKTLKSKMVAS